MRGGRCILAFLLLLILLLLQKCFPRSYWLVPICGKPLGSSTTQKRGTFKCQGMEMKFGRKMGMVKREREYEVVVEIAIQNHGVLEREEDDVLFGKE